MGEGAKRNDLCICGSGRKYKNCCIGKKDYIPISAFYNEKDFNFIEPHLNLIPSIEWQGKRIRPIQDRLYFVEPEKTFHDFLVDTLLLAIGKDFQEKMHNTLPEEQHVIYRWWLSFCEWSQTGSNIKTLLDEKEVYSGTVTGHVKAFSQLAYDIFCLQTVKKLPEALMTRLRNSDQFQGARYEIAIAAIMARAGFEINFLDGEIKHLQHCEFIAKHKISQIEIGVEAKSKHRSGVLNQKGTFDIEQDIKANIGPLFYKARKQKPQNMPFVIFIDINLPSDLLDEEGRRVWIENVNETYKKYEEKNESNPHVFNAVFFTNYSFYYGGNIGVMPNWEAYAILPNDVLHPIEDREVLGEIFESIKRYSTIPHTL
jgi:hypothetical protein